MGNLPNNPTKEPRLLPDYACAERFRVHLETTHNWAFRGWITAYVEGEQLWLDIDEIEAAFKLHPRMKDGRKSKWPSTANVKPLPKPTASGTPRWIEELPRNADGEKVWPTTKAEQ